MKAYVIVRDKEYNFLFTGNTEEMLKIAEAVVDLEYNPPSDFKIEIVERSKDYVFANVWNRDGLNVTPEQVMNVLKKHMREYKVKIMEVK